MKGTIKFFNDVKGFGFITGEDEKEYFVHESVLEEGTSLDKGDSVEFEIEKGDKGPKAVKVKKE
jgi:cold shock protein